MFLSKLKLMNKPVPNTIEFEPQLSPKKPGFLFPSP